MPPAHPEQSEAEKSYLGPEWFLVYVTVALATYTALLYRATVRLSKSADAAGTEQADKMQKSILEASRAATAMEDVALATKKNAELMQGVMHKQMRAYLVVEIGGAAYQDELLRFEVRPLLVNAGLTPAHAVTYWAKADILPFPLPDNLVLAEPTAPDLHNMVVGQRQSFQMNATLEYRVRAEEAQAVMQGHERRVCIWGKVSYKDIFDVEHTTEFCQSVHWVGPEDKTKRQMLGNFDMRRNTAT